MKKLILLIAFTVLIISCNTTEPLPPGTGITLKTEDVSSIEAWIKITTDNVIKDSSRSVPRDNPVLS